VLLGPVVEGAALGVVAVTVGESFAPWDDDDGLMKAARAIAVPNTAATPPTMVHLSLAFTFLLLLPSPSVQPESAPMPWPQQVDSEDGGIWSRQQRASTGTIP
jgi:hypothetical protein